MSQDPTTSAIPPAPTGYKLQIPQMPILGPPDFGLFLRNLYQAIVGEATAIDFYYRLLREAPNELHREFIDHAYRDEMQHLEAFTRLYCYFTGQKPQYTVTPVQYRSYREGLLLAMKDELEAAETYQEIILSSTDQLVRDTFFMAMTDEMEHATRFGFLYNSLR
ncbi:ferritin family protein [Desulfoscipio gibsoniae]|uniref:Rubrerythrin diiron-binding domain-containing protein n=1 Tax=Desulfoscipio gibsoniae DSM 7213 TaxID=767817 RepID=R4KED1_9FIRM|nr:ferritin-like domain-containing protein [Desulfoscipio gibsoniae]AGL01523.1 hypothetical protein Desgi_2089 [Desulfoscipio gibsoniae DSM 7213]